MNKKLLVTAVAAMLGFGAAQAQEGTETVVGGEGNRPHIFLTGSYSKPDSDRGTEDRGTGLQAGFGYPLSEAGRWWLEGRFDYSTLETGAGRGTDFYQSTLGADLQYAFGNREQLTPFLLAGLGYAYNDVVPDSEDSGAFEAEAGVGLVARIGNLRWLRGRGDARVVHDSFQDGYLDYRLHLGLEIALGPEKQTVKEVPVTVEKVVVREVLVPALDSDSDGIPDEFDRCPGTLSGAKVDGRGCVVESQTLIVLRDVSFDFDSARLQLNGQRLLDDVVKFLSSQSELKAEIVGHTDSIGTEAYNLKLSAARAASALNYLVGKGIAAERLSSKGLGKASPVASNETPEGREANRRVEFNIIAPPQPAASETPPPPSRPPSRPEAPPRSARAGRAVSSSQGPKP